MPARVLTRRPSIGPPHKLEPKIRLFRKTAFLSSIVAGMEYDLRACRRAAKYKGKNVVWSIAMDKCLIEALVIQAKNGNKVDKCFNETAYTAACDAVNAHFNLSLNNQKVINRLKTIKKRYKIIKDILSQKGFTWNPHTKIIEYDNYDNWKRYVTTHPDARAFQGKPIEMLEELGIVCGNYQARSLWAGTMQNGNHLADLMNRDDDSASLPLPTSEEMSETDGTETESSTGHPSYSHMPDENQELPPAHGFRQLPLPKRPRSSETLPDALSIVASSIRQLADALDRSKNAIDASELLQAVMEIDGIEEGRQMHAFECLNADPVKARAFMAYNQRMRKIYLFRQFLWWK
ncbi:hypothetical protein Nepgr_015118 [Nepenthes gracilis]|uniref:Myb/SANT-like domain-containing protein n=1 Tax=Nepenthes gracilis TaxID=150966 RepID=A0AAD3SMJ4_NEPGR|nr:hypothetical protein Nepgr_015118 [Nepenthes gracilis]